MGSTKKTSAAAERRAKIEELRRQERARERRNKTITVAVCAVIFTALAGGTGYLLVTIKGEEESARSTPIKGEKTWEDLSRNHVPQTVSYPMTPAAGGDHAQAWMNCDGDVYAKEVPQENAVHALEHGAVWVTYNTKAPAADIKTLEETVSKTPYSLLSPHPKQKSPITVTAWGRQLELNTASDPRLTTFLTKYVQGPQTPEPGAACTNGLPT
ncbi:MULTISPECIES: DUF3105 domain-containing protein [Streptomyces]|uniref:DUF3105 domain-containing protein n=1 Tax=Streptomyces TaxID=1883 RepID=UPI0010723AFA|nr:DUF3105 domain-containing protein [Streptomyces sp. 4R-3d]TFI30668.1 DUF3105 domain-containing protein [Streptomyces sp. 4R-3d]